MGNLICRTKKYVPLCMIYSHLVYKIRDIKTVLLSSKYIISAKSYRVTVCHVAGACRRECWRSLYLTWVK